MKKTKPSGNPPIPDVINSIHPSADFYRHVNGGWLRHAKIPFFAGSFGVSEEIEERVRGALLAGLAKLQDKSPDHPLSCLARSVINPHVQSNNVRDLRKMLGVFSCMRTTEDVATEIGRLNRIQSRAPLTLSVNADMHKSGICRVHIYEPILGLPAKHYYDSPTGHIVSAYTKMLKTVGDLLDVDGLERVKDIEYSIIPYLSDGDTPQETIMYDPYTFSKLEDKFRHIPWKHLFAAWGLDTTSIKSMIFIITSTNYIRALNNMFRTFDIETWKLWLRACLTLSYVEYLPPPFDDLHYSLYGRKLRGNTQKMPQKLLMLRVAQTFATQELSRIFVHENVKEDVKDIATGMVQRLKAAAINRIRQLKWMARSTKTTAIKKVEAMRFQVAFPNRWYSEFTGVQIDPARLVYNIAALCVRDTIKIIDTIGPGCGDLDGTWDDGAFDVNAYYYPDKNMLSVPAGILRPPFFDTERNTAWNYGGIGSAIGHEITHGFDADGKNYDLYGSFREWWTDKDNHEYDKMTRSLIELYDGELYAGGKVNGKFTLSENIADIGGVAIALDALSAEIGLEKADAATRKKAYKDFFTSYAVSWRNKDRPRKARQALYLDVHAPAPLRVNLVVRQFSEFYEAFDIDADSPGWIAPEKRLLLW
jgi:putative endopeptidase